MAWDPNEYPDENVTSSAASVLNNLEEEHQQTVQHEQQVVETLSEAMKRIEEANLWKTLLTLDVFQAGSARDEIVSNVNSKIKSFALSKLEACVGINQKQEAPKSVEVKLPFDAEETTALKILAAKVLKRDVSSAVAQQTYTPQVAQVATSSPGQNGPSINTVKTQGVTTTVKAQPKTVNMAPKKPTAKSNKPKPGQGYIPPQSAAGYVPPTQGGATVSSDGTSAGGVNLQNLVSKLIETASGGNVLAQNTGDAGGDDVNERF